MMDRSKRAAIDLMALLIENLAPEEAFDLIVHGLRGAKREMTLEEGTALVSTLAQNAQTAFLAKEAAK